MEPWFTVYFRIPLSTKEEIDTLARRNHVNRSVMIQILLEAAVAHFLTDAPVTQPQKP